MAIGSLNINGNIPLNFTDLVFQASIGVSSLGTVMYDNIVLSFKEQNESESFIRIDAVQFSVTQVKSIVKSEISGRDGTVKEYNNDGDYIIRCVGKLTNPDGRLFPEQPLSDFIRVAKAKQEVDVLSKILNEFYEITTVVIDEYVVQPNTGASMVDISFTLISDLPFDFKEFEIT